LLVNKTAKENKGSKLKTLWKRLGVGTIGIGAFADYVDNPEKSWIWR